MDSICCNVDTRDDGDSHDGGSSSSDHEEKILECDYDSKCTKLYKSIEGKKWDEIIYFLETGKWYFDTTVFTSIFFGSGPDPRFIESRTWVTALDEMGNVRWCQLPLHAAITFQAPFEVVKKLVEVYPESVRCADDQDMLPLHYTFRFGSEDKVLAYILEEFPQAVKKKALRDRLPLDMAHYSSRPERGTIIECYLEMSLAETLADRDVDLGKNISMDSQVKSSSLIKKEKLRNVEHELMEARKTIQHLEAKIRDRRTAPPGSRRWNGGSQRVSKEKKDDESQESVEEDTIDKKHKGFGMMFGRPKKQLIA